MNSVTGMPSPVSSSHLSKTFWHRFRVILSNLIMTSFGTKLSFTDIGLGGNFFFNILIILNRNGESGYYSKISLVFSINSKLENIYN